MQNPYKFRSTVDESLGANNRLDRLAKFSTAWSLLIGAGSVLMGVAYILTVKNPYTAGIVWYFGLGGCSLVAAWYFHARSHRVAIIATVVAYSIPITIHVLQGF